MTVKSNMNRHSLFSEGLLLEIEQWIALFVGVACLSVSSWAAVDGPEAFSMRRLSHVNTTTLVSIGWFLTILVGTSGVTLMRFAFYKGSEPEPDRKSLTGRVQMVSGGSTENCNRVMSITAGKRGR